MCVTSTRAADLLLMKVAVGISVLLMALAPLVPSSIAVVIIGIAAVISLRMRAMVAGVRVTVRMTRLAPRVAVFAMVGMTLPVAVGSICCA